MPTSGEPPSLPAQRLRAAAAVRDEWRRVLCVRHFNRGRPFWTLPGGIAEDIESIDAAVMREVLEETGWHVTLAGVLAVATFRADRWERPKVEVFFAATPVSQVTPPARNSEIIESQFFDIDRIPESFLPRDVVPLLATSATAPYIVLNHEEAFGETD